ncbi:MAG TPA: hypothetical protein VKB68_19255 [Stellaceae bacterium]|nr:hypothetical protein [Stellaceae bacterium]
MSVNFPDLMVSRRFEAELKKKLPALKSMIEQGGSTRGSETYDL